MNERFYDSQVFAPESEIPREEALACGHYVRALFEGDRVVRSEVVRPEGLHIVNYYDRDWPDEELLQLHRSTYPGVPARVSSAPRATGEGRAERTSVHLDREGALRARTTEVLDPAGAILEETTVDAAGLLVQRYRYEYEHDVLVRAWLVLPDGRELLEYDADE